MPSLWARRKVSVRDRVRVRAGVRVRDRVRARVRPVDEEEGERVDDRHEAARPPAQA